MDLECLQHNALEARPGGGRCAHLESPRIGPPDRPESVWVTIEYVETPRRPSGQVWLEDVDTLPRPVVWVPIEEVETPARSGGRVWLERVVEPHDVLRMPSREALNPPYGLLGAETIREDEAGILAIGEHGGAPLSGAED